MQGLARASPFSFSIVILFLLHCYCLDRKRLYFKKARTKQATTASPTLMGSMIIMRAIIMRAKTSRLMKYLFMSKICNTTVLIVLYISTMKG